MRWFDRIMGSLTSTKPDTVIGQNNQLATYYRQWCITRILERYELSGLPAWWSKKYFMKTLLLEGWIGITYVDELGVTPLRCGFSGSNLWDEPTDLIFSNHVLGNFEKKIGVNCELVYMDRNMHSYSELVSTYAYMLAICDSCIDVNLFNSRLANVWKVENAKEKKEIEDAVVKISQGYPAVYISKSLNMNMQKLPVKENYVANMIQETKREIMSDFYSELGINNANTRKKERLISDEVNSNNEQISISVKSVVDTVNECFERVNSLFDMNLKMKLRELKIHSDGGNF